MARRKNLVPSVIEALSKQMIPVTIKYNSKGVAIGITSIMGIKYDTMEEATQVASNMAGINLNPPKRRASSVLKDVHRYKKPIFEPIKQTIKVTSKTGKTYYKTILTQDVKLEHAFRSMQWQWNREAKKEGSNGNVRGKISSSGIQNYYFRHGRQETLQYIREMELRAKKKVSGVGSLDIINDVLDSIIARHTGGTETDLEMVQKAEQLKRLLLKAFSGKKGVDIYDMKETRQGLYEDELTDYEQLDRIEHFVRRQLASEDEILVKSIKVRV